MSVLSPTQRINGNPPRNFKIKPSQALRNAIYCSKTRVTTRRSKRPKNYITVIDKSKLSVYTNSDVHKKSST